METIPQLITQFRNLDIRLWAEEGDLCFSAPKGALSPALRDELVERKSDILSFLEEANRKPDVAEEICPVSRDQNLPLSFAQQRLWFLDQLEGKSAAYNIPGAMRLLGSLNADILEQALNEVIRRHESLRTTFVSEEGQPAQVIAQNMSISLNMTDLRHVPGKEPSAELTRQVANEAGTPFDLAEGPLIRAALLWLDTEEHLLIINMHHIISDGWSLDVFIREMAALYEAFSKGRPSPLPNLPIQYADFAVWQRERLKGKFLETELDYWKAQLADAPPLLELPCDRIRPRVQSYAGGTVHFSIPRELTAQLGRVVREAEATLFMALQAAFAVLLSRYSGQDDVVTGTPIANRNHEQIEPLIGFFVNTLALRTDLSGNPSFQELIARVRQTTLDAYQHQDVPFEYLVDALQPERSMGHSPIFQVMFALQTPSDLPVLPDMKLSPMSIDNAVAKFDLTLSLEETDQELKGNFEHNTDIFEPSTITRMTAHFKEVLKQVVADPEKRISDLSLLTPNEAHQMLVEWNDTAAPFPQMPAHALFEAQVERTPDATALVCGDVCLSYQELNARANQLAHHLRSFGIGPDVRVGLCTDRSPEMILGLLGILKAGGAYVPMDPAYPDDRIEYMLEAANIRILLTKETLAKTFPGCQVICLDRDWDTISHEDISDPPSNAGPENLCYVIFTSGTTGRPKGAGVYHKGFVNLVSWFVTALGLTHRDRSLPISSMSFDLTQKNFFAPLVCGGELHLLPGVWFDPNQIVRAVREHRITWLNCAPSAFYPLLDAAARNDFTDLNSLRYAVMGGEPTSMQRLWEWQSSPNITTTIMNGYGPTECSAVCAFYVAEDPEAFLDREIPCGRPISNARFYVLDRHLRPVPAGVTGEVYIGGVGVGAGYVNDPELTREKFIPDPFSDAPDARMYKAGDLARYLPDGNMEYLGRIDHQVKFRGFRIELGEIESVLEGHPGVRKAVVLIRPDASGEDCLTAYIVTDHESLASDDLRSLLRQKLPDYMVPSAFLSLERLPLTPNGKLDRRALPDPDPSETGLKEAYIAPRTSTEHIVAGVWGDILKTSEVGINDNFFGLGGHSLIATLVISRLRNEFSLDLPIRSLFEFPILKEFAEQIDMIHKILETHQEDADDAWEDDEEYLEF